MPQVNFLSTQVIWMQLAPLQAVINGNIFAVSISCCVTNQSSAVSFSQAERGSIRGRKKLYKTTILYSSVVPSPSTRYFKCLRVGIWNINIENVEIL